MNTMVSFPMKKIGESEEHSETLALLKLLELSDKDFKEGRFMSARELLESLKNEENWDV